MLLKGYSELNRTVLLTLLIFCISETSQRKQQRSLRRDNCIATTLMTYGNLANETKGNCSRLKTNSTTGNTTSSHESSDYRNISRIASLVVGAVGILCNVLLILVIIIDPLKILHRGAWVTILNLSFADLIACGTNFVRVYVYQFAAAKITDLIREEGYFFWLFGVGASFLLLTLLTVQIYTIIKYPMTSRLILTGKRVALSCGIAWVLAFLLGLSNIAYVWHPKKDVHYFYIAQIGVLEVAVAVQIVLKILIVIEILRSRQNLISASETQNQKQKEVAKTVIVLNVILIVTAFPYFLAIQIDRLDRLGHLGTDHPLITKFRYYYEPVALLNFVANPIVYSLRLQDYRRSLLALVTLGFIKRKRANSNQSQTMITRVKRASTNSDKIELTRL